MSNANWLEICWVLVGAVWGMTATWGVIETFLDWLYVRMHPSTIQLLQDGLRDRTNADLFGELASLVGAITITYFGVRSALLPPNSGTLEMWALIGGILASVFAAAMAFASVQRRVLRRSFDRRLRRDEERRRMQ